MPWIIRSSTTRLCSILFAYVIITSLLVNVATIPCNSNTCSSTLSHNIDFFRQTFPNRDFRSLYGINLTTQEELDTTEYKVQHPPHFNRGNLIIGIGRKLNVWEKQIDTQILEARELVGGYEYLPPYQEDRYIDEGNGYHSRVGNSKVIAYCKRVWFVILLLMRGF